jgi:uncharacterized protein (TIGR03435 family)
MWVTGRSDDAGTSPAKGWLGRYAKSALHAVALLCVVTLSQMNGQSNTTMVAKMPAYEVVSIKQPKGHPDSAGYGDLPNGFSMKNLTLMPLIPDAYGVLRNDQVSGWPGWATSARFDIEARMDAETADALHKLPKQQQEVQRRLMMQSLLADRFKLKAHRATEVRTTYELVLAKGGSKMKEDNPNSDMDGNKEQDGVRPSTDWMVGDGKISGHAMPVSILVNHLQGAVGAIVVNKTGLTKRYDVVLHWDSTDGQGSNSTEPSIFTAVEEQLGLRLKPAKTSVEVIVIDHLEMPSEN